MTLNGVYWKERKGKNERIKNCSVRPAFGFYPLRWGCFCPVLLDFTTCPSRCGDATKIELIWAAEQWQLVPTALLDAMTQIGFFDCSLSCPKNGQIYPSPSFAQPASSLGVVGPKFLHPPGIASLPHPADRHPRTQFVAVGYSWRLSLFLFLRFISSGDLPGNRIPTPSRHSPLHLVLVSKDSCASAR